MAADGPGAAAPRRSLHDRIEIAIAALLGLAAILVAVAGYQSTLRDGDSIKAFNEGIRSTNDSNAFFNEAVQTATRDQSLFLEFAKATQEDNSDLAQYLYENVMDDNLRGAVDEWQKDESNEIGSPLEAPAYALPQQTEGERLTKVTDRKFTEARALDDEGDQYSLVGVIVASALFFLGIAGVMSSMRTKVVGTAAGSISLLVAFAIWLTI